MQCPFEHKMQFPAFSYGNDIQTDQSLDCLPLSVETLTLHVCVCLCVCLVAVSVQECSPQQKDEIFITDVAYCEQAAILLKQAKLPLQRNSIQWKRDDGILPVTHSLSLSLYIFSLKLLYWHKCV